MHSLTCFTKAVASLPWLLDDDAVPISWLSIIAGRGAPLAYEMLGHMPLGRVFYDGDYSAHGRYGVSMEKGAVLVLRPDGWVGTVVELDGNGVEKLERYFSRFLLAAATGTKHGAKL